MSDISIFRSSVHIAEELGQTNLDKVHPLMWGKLWANLSLLKYNHPWTPEVWNAAIEHFIYPAHNAWPLPDGKLTGLHSYELMLKHVEELYQSI